MRRSAEFGVTVKNGARAAQPDLVVHARRDPDQLDGPRIGFVVSRAVGDSVDRHRVSRRLRHAARAILTELAPSDRVVVRALPSSRGASSARLEEQLQVGLRRTRQPREVRR
jgi:ribonuclease P protein component